MQHEYNKYGGFASHITTATPSRLIRHISFRAHTHDLQWGDWIEAIRPYFELNSAKNIQR